MASGSGTDAGSGCRCGRRFRARAGGRYGLVGRSDSLGGRSAWQRAAFPVASARRSVLAGSGRSGPACMVGAVWPGGSVTGAPTRVISPIPAARSRTRPARKTGSRGAHRRAAARAADGRRAARRLPAARSTFGGSRPRPGPRADRSPGCRRFRRPTTPALVRGRTARSSRRSARPWGRPGRPAGPMRHRDGSPAGRAAHPARRPARRAAHRDRRPAGRAAHRDRRSARRPVQPGRRSAGPGPRGSPHPECPATTGGGGTPSRAAGPDGQWPVAPCRSTRHPPPTQPRPPSRSPARPRVVRGPDRRPAHRDGTSPGRRRPVPTTSGCTCCR